MIMACAPVEISDTDGLPSKICENCLTKLQYSFLFRMQILQADIKLKNYARKTRVFHSNSVIRNFLPEPILKNSKSNIEEIYSLDQILQSSLLLDDESNKSSIKNKLKTEPIKNEITEFIDEVIVIPDEDVIHLKTENQIFSMESNKVQVEEVVKVESSNLPLHDETVVNPDSLPTVETCHENNETQIVPTPQIYCDDLSVTNNEIETGVIYNKHGVSSVMDSTDDCNAINLNNTLLDQTVSICSLQNAIFRDNANAILSLINKSDSNRRKPLATIKNVADDQSQVHESSDKLQKTNMYPTDERPLYGQTRFTYGKQSTTKRLSLVIKHIVNEKANNLDALEIPNKNLDLVQRVKTINTKMKNITGEKNDRSKTISNNAKSLKTGMDTIQECNNIEIKSIVKNKTIDTRTEKDSSKTATNKSSQVQIIANSAYKYPTNSIDLQNIPTNNNTVVAVNQTKIKQKPDKNRVISKDESNNAQNSHLSQNINLIDQITPVTSSVRDKACEKSSSRTKNCELSQKKCSNFMALMTVDNFKIIRNKPDAHSTFKLYKIPTNTLHESTVVNCIKQGNDVSVSDTSNPKNVKYQITGIKQDNQRITHSNSGSSTLSQPCVKSSIQKNVNNLAVINVKNSKQENTTITKTDFQQNFKRKANHKVYVNKRKKYQDIQEVNIFSDIIQNTIQ
ncbi:uncharacterized protein CBL_06586 [Carabus blaptoides fortunei]